jgi:hypothetical protein
MAAERVQDMTMEELTALIDARIRQAFGRRGSQRTMAEINESIDRNRWTPPPGAKSPREYLREDRDR